MRSWRTWRHDVFFLFCLAGCDAASNPTVTTWAGGGPSVACVPAADAGTCARSQTVLACDVRNARDLGGVPLAPSGSVACGQVFRGPPLSGLSPRGCTDAG